MDEHDPVDVQYLARNMVMAQQERAERLVSYLRNTSPREVLDAAINVQNALDKLEASVREWKP